VFYDSFVLMVLCFAGRARRSSLYRKLNFYCDIELFELLGLAF